MPVRCGEVYWVEFNPVKGSERGGPRPALVVQKDVGNRHSPTTIVVAITWTIPLRPYPFVVIVEPVDSGLPELSAIKSLPDSYDPTVGICFTTSCATKGVWKTTHRAAGAGEDG